MSKVYILSAWDNDDFDHFWVFSDRESAEAYMDALAPDRRKIPVDLYEAKRNGRYLFLSIDEHRLDPPLDTASDYL